MPKFEQKQNVKITPQDDKEVIQEAHLDTDDEAGLWIVVTHDGNSLSMSFENWNKLVKLAELVKSKII